MRGKRGLNPGIVKELAALVHWGRPRWSACEELGIPEGTFKRWVTKGRADRLSASRLTDERRAAEQRDPRLIDERLAAGQSEKAPSIYAELVTELEKAHASRLSPAEVFAGDDMARKLCYLAIRYPDKYTLPRGAPRLRDDLTPEECREFSRILREMWLEVLEREKAD